MTRPKSPGGTVGMGVFFLVVGLLFVIPTLADPDGTTQLGIPFPLAVIVLAVTGISFVAWGATWVGRDKRKREHPPDR